MSDGNINNNKISIFNDSFIPETFKGMYAMHKYWSRKPSNIINSFIMNYTNTGDIIMDPFFGSGVVISEALRTNRKAVGIDINPVATYITEQTINNINVLKFEELFNNIKNSIYYEINSLYKTKCPLCNNDATITHSLFNKDKITKIKIECSNHKKIWIEPRSEDLERYQEILKKPIEYWYPKDKLIWNSRVNVNKNMYIYDLFSKRNLLAITILFNEINKIYDENIKNMMLFVFTASLSQMSKLVFVIKRRSKIKDNGKRKSKETEEVGSWVAGFWTPEEHWEINVWNCFETRYKKTLRGKIESNKLIPPLKKSELFDDLKQNSNLLLKTADSTKLSFIPDNSIDYIITDPPHGDRIPYLELSMIWSAWLKLNLDFENEIVISNSPLRKKDIRDYDSRLLMAFKECNRVLKNQNYMTVAFNDRDIEVWKSFFESCWLSGFKYSNLIPVGLSAGSVVQDSREGALRGEFYITFQKELINQPNEKILNDVKKLLWDSDIVVNDYKKIFIISYFVSSGISITDSYNTLKNFLND